MVWLLILFKRYQKELGVRVKDLMSTPPITVGANTTIIDASKTMIDKGVGSLLVVDGEGHLVGIVTERDIIYSLARGHACRGARVGDIMSRNLIVSRGDEPIDRAIDRMREMNIRHLPVIDDHGKPIGVLSMRDILDAAAGLLKLIVQQ